METGSRSSNLVLLFVALYLTIKIWPRIKSFVQLINTHFRPDHYVPAEHPPAAPIQLLLDVGAEEIGVLGFTHHLSYDIVNEGVLRRCDFFIAEEPGTTATVVQPLLPELRPYDLLFETRFRSPQGETFDCQSIGGLANIVDPDAQPHVKSFGAMGSEEMWEKHL